jgi:hypothetical protein
MPDAAGIDRVIERGDAIGISGVWPPFRLRHEPVAHP